MKILVDDWHLTYKSEEIPFLVDKNLFLLKFVDVATQIKISGHIHFLVDQKKIVDNLIIVWKKILL